MPLRIIQFNRAIATHGDMVIHYRGNICSCSSTGRLEEADLTCRKCNGLGVFWSDPKPIRAIITGLDSDRMGRHWLQNGIALPEDMSCSTYPAYARRFKDYDKVIPTWRHGFPYAGELLRRGEKDTLIYKPVGRIQKVSKVNPESGIETLWTQDVDYTMTGEDGKEVMWISGHGPAFDEVYAVVYEPRFEFVAWASPGERWERGRDLGRRILLRKVHLPWPKTNWG
jgi:hypothetical protein